MKNYFKGILFLSSVAMFTNVTFAAGDLGLTASSIKLKVYKMAVSTSPLCTNLITVLDNGSSPVEVDFLQNPSLGSGTLADGNYPCVVIEFSDLVKFTPSTTSTSNHCNSATEYTLDVCRGDNGGGSSVLINGSITNCTGTSGNSTTYGTPGDDRVAMYISTASTGSNNSDAFNRPTSIGDTNHGLNLAAALSISGTAAGKFVVNPTGQVCDGGVIGCQGAVATGGTRCEMGPPAFSFTKL
jgi:hypothetical protein